MGPGITENPDAADKKDSAGNILTYDVIFTTIAQLSCCWGMEGTIGLVQDWCHAKE